MRSLTLILPLALLLLASCGSDDPTDDCADLSCVCLSTSDCPAGYGCSETVCHPRGDFPRGVECAIDDDCGEGLICQDYLGICTETCNYGSADTCGDWICHSSSECLPPHSLELGSGCFNDLLCPLGSTCLGGSVFKCGIPCATAYGTDECPDGWYCGIAEVPACVSVPSPCDVGTNIGCATPRICVELGGGATVCRTPCTHSVDSGGIFSDDCPAQVGSFPATCAPLAAAAAAVCVEAVHTGGAAGSTCDASNLCNVGTTCLNGRCRALCSASTSCGTLSCQPIGGGFSACLP